MYEVDNCLALVRYDYAKVVVVEQHVVCLSEGEELDQERGYASGEPKKMGRKQR
jgi:hypothetical protein